MCDTGELCIVHIKVSVDEAYNVTYYLMEGKMFKHGPLYLEIIQILLVTQNKLIYRTETSVQRCYVTFILLKFLQKVIFDIL